MNRTKIYHYCILVFMLTLLGCTPETVADPTEKSPTQIHPTQTTAPPTQELPTATVEIPEITPTPTFAPPAGFKPYQDTLAGVTVYIPESWVVTNIDPGQSAVLQSYPEDKYVGGEGFEPGDTKCDLTIHQSGISAADLIDQWKSNPETTIISEQEIVLLAGQIGTRIETENCGSALSLITEVNEQTVVLTCFGEFAPFDEIAATLIASELAPVPISETLPGEPTVSAVVILAEAGLNLRTEPNVTSVVVGILPQNELVEVTGVSPDGEWWQVACPEGTVGDCWITADPRWSEPAS